MQELLGDERLKETEAEYIRARAGYHITWALTGHGFFRAFLRHFEEFEFLG